MAMEKVESTHLQILFTKNKDDPFESTCLGGSIGKTRQGVNWTNPKILLFHIDYIFIEKTTCI